MSPVNFNNYAALEFINVRIQGENMKLFREEDSNNN